MGQYLKMNKDEWLRSAWEEGLIKKDENPKVYRERTSNSRMEEWHSKPMHGKFLKQTKGLSSNDTLYGFREGNSRKRQKG